MDICFFHPFENANARAARLALEYVLTANGLALVAAEPVFLFPRHPESAYFALTLQHLCAKRCFEYSY